MVQIGRAVHQYADDYHGFKPQGNAIDGVNAYWFAQLGGTAAYPDRNRYLVNPFSFDKHRKSSFWYCKKYEVGPSGSIPRVTYGINKYQGWSRYLKLEQCIRVDDKVEKVPQLSKAAYIFCGVSYGMDCTATYGYTFGGWQALHNSGNSVPVLYLDGHCNSVSRNFIHSSMSTKTKQNGNGVCSAPSGIPDRL